MPAADLDPPRYCPISPITSASGTIRSRGSIGYGYADDDDAEVGPDGEDTGDDEDEDESDGISSFGLFKHSYGDSGKRPKPAPGAGGGGGHSILLWIPGSDFRTPTAPECSNLSSRYALVAFPTSQILEDDFPIPWHSLHSAVL